MLVLSRKLGERLMLGDDIVITVVDIDRHKIRLGIDAPKSLPILREEIYHQIRSQRKEGKNAADKTAETGANNPDPGPNTATANH